MKLRFFLTQLFMSFVYLSVSQSHNTSPPWISGQYPQKFNGVTFKSFKNEGNSLNQVRNDSRKALIFELATKQGVKISGINVTTGNRKKFFSLNGLDSINNYTSSQSTYELITDTFLTSFYLVEEFYEIIQDGYRYWGLFAISEDGTPLSFKPIEYTTDYGLEPVWRSAIIPGWGQFYKRKTGRGIAFLVSEAALISTTIYCESMRADNMRKSEETLNIDVVKEYRKRADTWELRRNVAIGGAIAVYALNLLDAAKGKGQIKYAFLPGNVDLLAYKEGEINQFGLKITF